MWPDYQVGTFWKNMQQDQPVKVKYCIVLSAQWRKSNIRSGFILFAFSISSATAPCQANLRLQVPELLPLCVSKLRRQLRGHPSIISGWRASFDSWLKMYRMMYARLSRRLMSLQCQFYHGRSMIIGSHMQSIPAFCTQLRGKPVNWTGISLYGDRPEWLQNWLWQYSFGNNRSHICEYSIVIICMCLPVSADQICSSCHYVPWQDWDFICRKVFYLPVTVTPK